MATKMTRVYRGRFAPSPTGKLHFGTLIAAVGSYLDAKANKGEWLVRIEDVDLLRRVEGMDSDMLSTLEALGFEWDGEVVYQSQRTQYYEDALQALLGKQSIYRCTCSRKLLAETSPDGDSNNIYPGTCRDKTPASDAEYALRIRVDTRNDKRDDSGTISFDDGVMGRQGQQLASECGDFIIKRRDGLFAYQLTVAVDDALQGITDIVRGADLIDSTPRQIYLQQCLGYSTPAYSHLPLAVDSHGQKLGKSTSAQAVDTTRVTQSLHAALAHLGQQPPDELKQTSIAEFWQWAIQHWNIHSVPQQAHIRYP